MNIQWQTDSSELLMNPCYSFQEQQQFKQILDVAMSFKGHLWLATSGSSAFKWVGLSKQAILTSAKAVNTHLASHSLDKWIQTLPDFHVGGLGIWARSYLSGASVINFKEKNSGKWSAHSFYHFVQATQGTLTSLVPAQLYDLVQLGLPAPESLRAVIVGGGSLSPELYHQAVKLGWKILPSYGLTECASQVATAQLDSWNRLGTYPNLNILPHIQVKQGENGCLAFKGSSLLSAYVILKEALTLYDPKIEGWFNSEDRGEIKAEKEVHILGRVDQIVKIGGESVDLVRLEKILQGLMIELNMRQEMTLISFPDQRLGHVIQLVVVEKSLEVIQPLLTLFNQRVLPFEKIRQVHLLPFLPKSPLLKILKNEIIAMIKAQFIS